MRLRSVAVLLMAALALPLPAANLGRFAGWPSSPPGYFMTKAERAQWRQLRSEDEAAQFVAAFVQRRGARFEQEVAERARIADERLSIGHIPGSRTLRGKIVIVLGPPSSCSIVQRKKVLRMFGSKDFHPGKMSTDTVPSSGLSDMDMNATSEYTLTYARAALPGNATKDEVIVVEADPSGADRITDSRMARRVDALLEAAAEARAKPVPPPQ